MTSTARHSLPMNATELTRAVEANNLIVQSKILL